MAKIFVASTGRCGTLFMTEIFKLYTEYPSFHEARPLCIDQTLREVNNKAGMTKESKIELNEKMNQISKDSENGNYFESCHLFIKSYVHLVAYRKDFQPIFIIYLHRNPIDVLLSYLKKTPELDLGWHLQPHWQNCLLRAPKGLSFCEIVLWEWHEVRARYLIWKDKFVKTWDFNFLDINNTAAWKTMFNHFDIEHKSLPEIFPADLKKNEHKMDLDKAIQIMYAKWNQKGADKTISAQDHFFESVEKRIVESKEKE